MTEIPNEVVEIAKSLRATFGPGVKLLRVVSDDGHEWGNATWDQLCQEIDNANP